MSGEEEEGRFDPTRQQVVEVVPAESLAGAILEALRLAVAAERARCAAVCREVAARERAYGNIVGRCVADICAEAIERGEVRR